MVNDITQGVAFALYEKFGNAYTIYTEDIEQGLKEPCFFIAVLNMAQRQYIGERYQQDVPIDVHYFSSAKRKRAEMNNVAADLYDCLRQIKLPNGDLLNGLQLHHEIVDGVLHFFVRYKPIVRYPTSTPAESMGGIRVEQRTK